MKKKKSRMDLAREIIANLRLGMNRPANAQPVRNTRLEATPFMPVPMPVTHIRTKRSHTLQTLPF
jgi:hypothetical protein